MGFLKKLVSIFIGASMFTMFPSCENVTLEYSPSDELLDNPFMGNVIWASNDFEDIEQSFSMVYVDVTWAELEPERGVFDFERLEKKCQFELWKLLGKHAVFRFVLDEPSDEEGMDIPEWLYDMTGDGKFYDISYGKGYCPNYANEVLIAEHARVIAAIGERYGDDNFISFVELGSLGHWGEWHVNRDAGTMPLMDVCARYLDPYTDAFTYAKLLMRRPFAIGKDIGIGLYNDSSALPGETERWLNWIENGGAYDSTGETDAIIPMRDAWRTYPIGGELSSSLNKEELLYDNAFPDVLSMLVRSHTSWLGPGSFARVRLNENSRDNYEELMKTLGYRLYVSNLHLDGKEVEITVSNAGIAPFYFEWDTVIRAEYSDGSTKSYTADFDIRTVMPDESQTFSLKLDKYPVRIYIGVLNSDADDKCGGLKLAMDTARDGYMQLIYEYND